MINFSREFSDLIHKPEHTPEVRAALIVLAVKWCHHLPGWEGRPMTVRRLADSGVSPLHELPYDTDQLRTLVQEYAADEDQLIGFHVESLLPAPVLDAVREVCS